MKISNFKCQISNFKLRALEIGNWKLEIPRLGGAGFTLVEILVAVGIVATLLGASIAYIDPAKQIGRVKDAKRATDLDQVKKALDLYYNDKGCYPATQADIPFGNKWSAATSGRGSNTLYMEQVPQDSKYPYQYFAQPPASGSTTSCPQWYTLFAQLDAKPELATTCHLDPDAGAACVPADYGTNPTTGPFYTCKTSSSANCRASSVATTEGSSTTLLCYPDGDGDGFAIRNALGAEQPTGVRACPSLTTKKQPLTTGNPPTYDCDDTENTIRTPTKYCRDHDGDRYCDAFNSSYFCPRDATIPIPSDYITQSNNRGSDCDDTLADRNVLINEYRISPPVCDAALPTKTACIPPNSPEIGYSLNPSGLNTLCTPDQSSGTFALSCTSAGSCSSISQYSACTTDICPNGSPALGSKCTTLATDNNNCGGCGRVCGSGAACFNGSCVCANSSLTSCGGACVDLQTSNTNCGACGNPCTAVGAVCSSGACVNPRRVFATSTTYTGNLGGIAGADAKCQERADRAGLDGGKWRAWISGDKISAKNRLRHFNVAYKLLDGTTIANNWTDLTDGTLQNPINRSELGESVVSSSFVFTGTTVNGSYGLPNCNNFFSSDAAGGNIPIGDALRIDGRWTNLIAVGGVVCGSLYRLYCFEDLPAFSPDTNNSLENNLAGYWKLEEAPGNFKDSIGTRTITNTSIESSRGVIGNAGIFNGASSYGTVGSVIVSPLASSLSFQAWFKGTDSGPGPVTSLVKNPIFGTPGGLHYISLGVDDGYISVASSDMGKIWGTGRNIRVTDGINWHHLVWVNSNGRMSMYVDGVLEAGPFLLSGYSSYGFYISNLGYAGSSLRQSFLNGSIDEIAYWTKALTQQEITDLYNSGRGNTYKGGQ